MMSSPGSDGGFAAPPFDELRATRGVSVLIPTLNSARTLPKALEALKRQRYPQDRVEIIVADGGSSDDTWEIAERYGARVVHNGLKTGEAGKAAALRHAQNELVALIDSDNIVVGTDWLARMVEPFEDASVLATEPLRFHLDDADTVIDRYCAIYGVNDPLCLFIGNYDRMSAMTGRWTGLPIRWEERSGDYWIPLDQPLLPTFGANGTMYRRDVILPIVGDYLMDIDLPAILGQRNHDAVLVKVDVAVQHLFCADTKTFIRKQTRRVRDFQTSRLEATQRTYPWRRMLLPGIGKFVSSTLTVVPLLWQSARAYRRTKDSAAFFHPVACWLTLWVYATNVLFGRRRTMSREGWSQ